VLGKLDVVVRSLHPQHVNDARHELFVVERLRQVVVCASAKPLNPPVQIPWSREKKNWDEAILGDRLDDFAGINSVEPG